MSIFLIKYVSKAGGSRQRDTKRTSEHFLHQMSPKSLGEYTKRFRKDLCIYFALKYLLKAEGCSPGDPKRTYEHIPYEIFLKRRLGDPKRNYEHIPSWTILNSLRK